MKTQSKLVLSVLVMAAALLSACVSDVMQLSENTFMVSKTSSAGAFASKSSMQAKAIKAANEFAAKRGKVAVATGTEWERLPQGFPTFTYYFKIVDADSAEAKDAVLRKTPDIVIEDARN